MLGNLGFLDKNVKKHKLTTLGETETNYLQYYNF